jgi:hypothetical protein
MAFLSRRAGLAVAVLVAMCVPRVGAFVTQSDRQAASTPVRVNANGTVSIKADGVAVQVLLEALEAACPIQLRLDAKAAARLVSIDVPDLAPAEAVGAVLKASELDFAMHTRCGTIAQPALVIVRLAGDGPIVSVAPRVDPDDPRVKRAVAEDVPPLPAGPPPEPEKRDDVEKSGAAGTLIGMPGEQREPAPGEVTGAQMAELLSVTPAQKAAASTSPVIELPFTDENGQPVQQIRPPKSNTVILPFPDANGNLVEIPLPTGPRPKTAGFPVVNPPGANSAPGQPPENGPGATNPQSPRRPGGGGSDQ